MTHLCLAGLTLDEIRDRGAQARQMGMPYFGANPFVADDSTTDFDVWAAKVGVWWAGWLHEDRGRDKVVQAHLHGPRFK